MPGPLGTLLLERDLMSLLLLSASSTPPFNLTQLVTIKQSLGTGGGQSMPWMSGAAIVLLSYCGGSESL
jgi:hypothetical protein